MRTISARELERRPEHVLRELQTEKEMIVTRYGKPVAIIVPVTEENLEDALNLARRQGPERASCATLKSTARRGKPVT